MKWAAKFCLRTIEVTCVLLSLLVQLQAQCPKPVSTLENALKTAADDCSRAKDSREPCPIGASKTKTYALIKDCDPAKPHGYLVIPTASVSGIEAKEFDKKKYEQIWVDAWKWSKRFPDVPSPHTGLAINSASRRSINQLHMHVSCVVPEVSEKLAREQASIPSYDGKASQFEIEFPIKNVNGGTKPNFYRVVKVPDLSKANNPLKVMKTISSRWNPASAQTCSTAEGKHSSECQVDLAVIGTQSGDGYFVLTYERGTDNGAAEGLLDQRCAAAGEAH
jgi:CDP-diacylglycerol pyrophosphatase